MQGLAMSRHPVEEKMRVLDLRVTTPDGDVQLALAWDMTPHDLEPMLTAGSAVPDDRQVIAYAAGEQGPVDLLEVPLGKALRSPENPDGAEELLVEVQLGGDSMPLTFTVRCGGLSEPEPHLAYPRAADPGGQRLVEAYRSVEESDWFCDGSSSLSCCAAARDEPESQTWVAF